MSYEPKFEDEITMINGTGYCEICSEPVVFGAFCAEHDPYLNGAYEQEREKTSENYGYVEQAIDNGLMPVKSPDSTDDIF